MNSCVKCSDADKYPACSTCLHAEPHEPFHDITTWGQQPTRDICTKESECSTGNGNIIKCRCVFIEEKPWWLVDAPPQEVTYDAT